MGEKTRWFKDRQREGYYRLAKKEGYRARSAYKFMQIQEKYEVLRKGEAVADLGCAPGGWSQVLVELVGEDGLVIGVDLQRMKPLPGAKFIQGDFTNRETHKRLAALLADSGHQRLDCVVSDMAPDMSGNYDTDQARSIHLAFMALDFADKHLQEGGHFVTKVFEGIDFQEYREQLRARFKKVYQFHPPASRKTSSEIYMVCKGYQGHVAEAPAKKDDDEDPVAKSLREEREQETIGGNAKRYA